MNDIDAVLLAAGERWRAATLATNDRSGDFTVPRRPWSPEALRALPGRSSPRSWWWRSWGSWSGSWAARRVSEAARGRADREPERCHQPCEREPG
jgi:hypothetical protein